MLENRLRAQQVLRQRVGRLGVEHIDVALAAEDLPERLYVMALGDLVKRDAHDVAVDTAQVDAELARLRDHDVRVVRDAHLDRVEVRVVEDIETAAAEALGEDRGEAVHALGNRPQPLGAVVDGVHAGDHGEQHLRGADVRGRLVAADVLLARLQGEAQRGRAVGVDRDAHEASWHQALEPIADGHVGGMRTAEADRHAEPLHRADGNIGTHRGRRRKQDEGQRIGSDDGESIATMELLDRAAPVAHATVCTRMLQERTDEIAVRQPLLEVGDHNLNAERLGAGLDHGDRLRQRVGVDEERARVLLRVSKAQRHRLGRGRCLIKQRRVGTRQARQIGDDRLVVEQRLEAPLRNLRLVRRVRRVPGRILEHLAEHHLRGMRAVVAKADHLRHDAVALTDLAQLIKHFDLGCGRRDVERLTHQDRLRHSCSLERIKGVVAELVQHRELVGLARADVPRGERRRVLELKQRRPLRVRGRVRLRSHLQCLSRTRPKRSHSP